MTDPRNRYNADMSTAAISNTGTDLLEFAKEQIQKHASDMRDRREYGEVYVRLEFVKGRIAGVTHGVEATRRAN